MADATSQAESTQFQKGSGDGRSTENTPEVSDSIRVSALSI